MKKLFLLTAILIALACAIWAVTRTDASPATSIAGSVRSPTTDDSASETLMGETTDSPPERRKSLPGKTQAVLVHGRVTAVGQGPVSDCPVEVFAQSAHRALDRTIRAKTDTAGHFAVRLPQASYRSVRLAIRKAGFATVTRRWAPVPTDCAAGRVVLVRGVPFRATVVNPEGNPLEGVRLTFRTLRFGLNTSPRQEFELVSSIDGSIQNSEPVAPGPLRVSVKAPAQIRAPRGRRIDVDSQGSTTEQEIVVWIPAPNATLSGRVLLPDGNPAANTSILTVRASGYPTSGGHATTDKGGRFQIYARGREPRPMQLSVPRAPGCQPFVSKDTYSWGTSEILLQLIAAEPLEIELLAADTGEPIPRFEISWFPIVDGRPRSVVGSYGRIQQHPDGVATLLGLRDGELVLIAKPDDPSYAPTPPTRVVHPSDKRVRLVSARRVKIPVLVVDATEQPVSEADLDLVRNPHNVKFDARTLAFAPERFHQSPSKSYLLQLDQGQSAPNGEATLYCTAAGGPVTLRLKRKDYLPILLPITPRPDHPQLRLVVQPGASVRGTVGPSTLLDRLRHRNDTQRARRHDAQVMLYPESKGRPLTAQIDAAGKFRFDGLGAGTWRPVFRVLRGGGTMSSRAYYKTFPSITTRDGSQITAPLDISDMTPGALRGQVLVNGAPQPGRSLRWTRVGNSSGTSYARTQTNARGEFTADELQPGRYRLTLSLHPSDRALRVTSKATVEVIAGQTTQTTLRLQVGRLRARIVDGEGRSFADQAIEIYRRSNDYRTGTRTDHAGNLDMRLERGTYEVRALQPHPKPPISIGEVRVRTLSDSIQRLKLPQ